MVRVEAAGVNRPDVHQRQGHYPPPPGVTDVLGLEIAGEVVALGPNARVHRHWRARHGAGPRRRLRRLLRRPRNQCVADPRGLTAIEAAAIPETYFTVWTNVFARGALKAGETLLVHGGRLRHRHDRDRARQGVRGARRRHRGSDEKARQCERLGADLGVNYRTDDFVAADASLTGGRGADVISTWSAATMSSATMPRRRWTGGIVQIAYLKGQKATVDLRPIMTEAPHPHRLDPAPALAGGKGGDRRSPAGQGWPLLEAGRCRPVIDCGLPSRRSRKAHERIENAEHFGKIVLTT